jgi:hypothetical protein
MLRSWQWPFFVALKSNRNVDPDGKGNKPVSELEFEGLSRYVHLRGFGWVNLYRVINEDDENEPVRFFIGSEEILSDAEVQQRRENAGQIEQYHRGLKQECHVERCQARKVIKQKNYIGLAIRAFIRLEIHFFRTGISRFEAKFFIIRDAIRRYLEHPIYTL